MFTKELWAKFAPIILNQGINDNKSLRLTYGDWNNIHKRSNDWSKSDKLMAICRAVAKNLDMELKFIDESYDQTKN
jgi:hypothetical protein